MKVVLFCGGLGTRQLSDFPLPELIDFHLDKKMIASFLSVRPRHSFHQLELDDEGIVSTFGPGAGAQYWTNGGFMVLNREIFDYIRPGEELVEEPFQRLLAERKLGSRKCTGFWASMDTFKDKIMFDRLHGQRNMPWEIWRQQPER